MRHGRETRFQHRLKRMQTLSGEAERVRESFSTTDRDRSDRNKQQQSNTRDKTPGVHSSHLHLSKYQTTLYAPRSRFLAARPGVLLLRRRLLQSLSDSDFRRRPAKNFRGVCEAAERMRQVRNPTPGSHNGSFPKISVQSTRASKETKYCDSNQTPKSLLPTLV